MWYPERRRHRVSVQYQCPILRYMGLEFIQKKTYITLAIPPVAIFIANQVHVKCLIRCFHPIRLIASALFSMETSLFSSTPSSSSPFFFRQNNFLPFFP